MMAMKEPLSTMAANDDAAPASARVPAAPAASAPAVAPTPVAAPIELKFADPPALGLFGLAIGCAALLPIAFGMKTALTPDGMRTAAVFCLLFGGGCQFLAGLMSFANKNMLGGTLLTPFSFNWVMNWWALQSLVDGKPASSAIILGVDACFLLIFFA